MAVTSQSTRKVVNQGLLNALATALVLRAVSDDPGRVDQVRRYLRRSFGKAVHAGGWQPTGRDTAALVEDALAEMMAAIGADRRDDPGPSTLELAVRSAFTLVVDGRLIGDRGTAGNTQPDRRTPGEVLDAMRQSMHGIHQLGRALADHAAARAIRAVDEDGAVVVDPEGTEVIVNDTILRGEFPGAGNPKARRPGDTPGDRYANALAAFADAMRAASDAFDVLGAIEGDDGRPMVDVKGVEGCDCVAWRETLDRIDEELVVWSRTHRRVIGVDGGRRKPDVINFPRDECDVEIDDVAIGETV